MMSTRPSSTNILVNITCIPPEFKRLDYISKDYTCFDSTIDLLLSEKSNTCLAMIDEKERNDNLTCPFHFHLTGDLRVVHLPMAMDLEDMTWSCTLDASQICDGSQDCLTDECHCPGSQADVFYCAD